MKNQSVYLTVLTLASVGDLASGANIFPPNGNAGIGTTSPSWPLDVVSSQGVGRFISTATINGAVIELRNDTPNPVYLGAINFNDVAGSYSGQIGYLANGAMIFRAGGIERVRLSGNGNFGIGTTTPSSRLQVVDGVGSQGTVQVGAVVANGDPKLIRFGDVSCATCVYIGENGADDRMELNASRFFFKTGSVGIGTATPQAPLDVAGQVRATTLLLTSDRNAKSNFHPVDKRDVLKKLAGLPVTTWEYTNAPGVIHKGVMAQDFKAAFNLGEDDKHIATVDADGVLFASVQALHEMVQEKDVEIAALKRQMSSLQTELAGVKNSVANRLAALEKAMSKEILQASFRPTAAR